LAAAAASALRWGEGIPADRLTVAIEDAHVVLRGTVDWHVQRDAAIRAVISAVGAEAVVDRIVVQPRVSVSDVRGRIQDALRRTADDVAQHINIAVDGHTVTLAGHVRSWAERQAAADAAWAAPGIALVEDRLTIAQ
jgi:osmotically-inducible protein OsmY